MVTPYLPNLSALAIGLATPIGLMAAYVSARAGFGGDSVTIGHALAGMAAGVALGISAPARLRKVQWAAPLLAALAPTLLAASAAAGTPALVAIAFLGGLCAAAIAGSLPSWTPYRTGIVLISAAASSYFTPAIALSLGVLGASVLSAIFLVVAILTAGTVPPKGIAGNPRFTTGLAAAFLAGGSILELFGSIRMFDLLMGETIRALMLTLGVQFALLAVSVVIAGLFFRKQITGVAALTTMIGTVGAIALFAHHPELPLRFSTIAGAAPESFSLAVRARLTVALIALFPLAIPAGILLAAILRSGSDGEGTGRPVLVGAAVGSAIAMAAFPHLVAATSIRTSLIAGVVMVAASAILLLWVERPWGGASRILVTVLSIGAAFLVITGAPRWHQDEFTTAPYRYCGLHMQIGAEEFEPKFALMPTHYKEGKNRTVSVVGVPASQQFRLNGLVPEGDAEHKALFDLLGRIPLLFQRETKSALQLGLGVGVSAGVLLDGGVERVTVVELEEASRFASRYFGRMNHKYWEHDGYTAVTADLRQYLRSSGKVHDLVIGSPFLPWGRRSAHIGGLEYYQEVRKNLAPGGIVAQWIPFIGLRETEFKSLLRSFIDSFDHVIGFQPGRHFGLILLGSDQELKLPLAEAIAQWGDPVIGEEWRALDIGSVAKLVALARCDRKLLDKYTEGAPPHRDGRLDVEFGSEEVISDLAGRKLDRIIKALHFDANSYMDRTGLAESDEIWFQSRTASAYRKEKDFAGGLPYAKRAYQMGAGGNSAEAYADLLWKSGGEVATVIQILEEGLEEYPDTPILIRRLADVYLAAEEYAKCEELMTDAAENIRMGWVYLLRGRAKLGQNKLEEARDDLLRAKDLDRLQDHNGTINYYIALANKQLGNLEESIEYVQKALYLNRRHYGALYLLGENKYRLGNVTEEKYQGEYLASFNRARADSLFHRAEWNFFEERFESEVERDLILIINTTPNHYGAYLMLAEFYWRRENFPKEGEVLSRMIAQFGGDGVSRRAFAKYCRQTGGEKKLKEYTKTIIEPLLG